MNDIQDTKKLDQKAATQLTRLFNVAFNSAFLYGGDHPTTKKSIEPFASLLIPLLEQIESVSIVLDRESLFLEEFCFDSFVNCKRIIALFKKSGIISVTFNHGIRLVDIQKFIKLSVDCSEELTIDTIDRRMKELGCHGIRLNYVRYGKITGDQTVVGKEIQQAAHTPAVTNDQNGQINDNIIQDIENIATLSQLVDQPEKTASVLKKGIQDPDTKPLTLNALTELRKSMASSSQVSTDLLLNAVYELKADLAEVIEAQRVTGKILGTSDPVTDEVDELTIDVIVKLVKEEYHEGDLSLKRLSQVLIRMLPDLNELKRVLPKLKIELISQGMSLTDYCHMVKLLDAEVESDRLCGTLVEASEGIGVSVEEIISAIKEQPSEAARLIYLAAEIRQGVNADDTQLSNLLAEYIEKVTTDLAIDKTNLTGPQGIEVLRAMLIQLEDQLLDKLKKNRVEDAMLQKVKNQLSSRFEGLVARTSEKWLSNIIPEQDKDVNESVKKITSFFGRTFDTNHNRDSLVNALKNKGYDQERIDTFFERLTEHVSEGYSISLPRNVLSSNNMLFLLNREIKQQSRHAIPLSTIMITIVGIKTIGKTYEHKISEIDILLPQMFRVIKTMVREVDLVGTLGEPFSKTVFIIMSMTNSRRAHTMAQRINSILCEEEFIIGKDKVLIQPAISVTCSKKNVTTDLKTYLELVRKNHKQVLNSLSQNED